MTTTTHLSPPKGLKWRSNTGFILFTVAIGMFTDLFLYGLVVPVLPFLLKDRLNTPHSQIQTQVSFLLACYAGAQVLSALPIGIIADRLPTRQLPFLVGLSALFASTILLYLGQELWVLVLARVLQGVSAGVVWTIGMAMIVETVGSGRLGVMIGTIFGFISVGELAAPVLGGVVYKQAGSGAVFGMGFGLIAVDLVLRLLVIEKKVAVAYGVEYPPLVGANSGEAAAADEESPLLVNGKPDDDDNEDAEDWKIPVDGRPWIQKLPILYCLGHPRMLTAGLLTFTQAMLLAVFDATVPLEAYDLFGFDSLKSGLLFIPLVLPSLILGPICGRAVDKYGVKPAAVIGLTYAVIPLILLRVPQAGGRPEIIKFGAFLGLCSMGLALVSAPSIVEASYVIEQYYAANKELFGEEGPYAQLYAVNSMVFSLGLTAGPIFGTLRESIGYGNMNALLAGMCGVEAILSFVYLGGKPRILRRKRNRRSDGS